MAARWPALMVEAGNRPTSSSTRCSPRCPRRGPTWSIGAARSVFDLRDLAVVEVPVMNCVGCNENDDLVFWNDRNVQYEGSQSEGSQCAGTKQAMKGTARLGAMQMAVLGTLLGSPMGAAGGVARAGHMSSERR
ncbi:hypothetical protein ACP70R_013286 [Stipagrostis hirtigluma subsp. patula]